MLNNSIGIENNTRRLVVIISSKTELRNNKIRNKPRRIGIVIIPHFSQYGISFQPILKRLISSLKENYPGQIDMREVADLAKKNLK